MRSLRDIGNPYQHALDVSIVRGQVSGDGGQRYDRRWGSVEKEK